MGHQTFTHAPHLSCDRDYGQSSEGHPTYHQPISEQIGIATIIPILKNALVIQPWPQERVRVGDQQNFQLSAVLNACTGQQPLFAQTSCSTSQHIEYLAPRFCKLLSATY